MGDENRIRIVEITGVAKEGEMSRYRHKPHEERSQPPSRCEHCSNFMRWQRIWRGWRCLGCGWDYDDNRVASHLGDRDP